MDNRDIVVSLIFTMGLFLYSWLMVHSLSQSCPLDKKTPPKLNYAAEFDSFDPKQFVRRCLLPKNQ